MDINTIDMKFFYCVVIFFLQVVFVARAQRVCGSTDYTQKILLDNPSLKAGFDKAEAQINFTTTSRLSSVARDTGSNEIIYIPVIIHIIYKSTDQNLSTDQILSQLKSLNDDYSGANADSKNIPVVFKPYAADTRIRFCLAQVDPQGKRTTGIIRTYTANDAFAATDGMKFSAQGGDNAWDSKRYLNIWVCKLSGRTLGYATLPGCPANVDGVVIGYNVFGTIGNLSVPFNKGRTATHEVGHWLGLKHIWGDAVCGSDDVNDTPTQQYYNYGTPTFPHAGNCSPNSDGDMFMNYMDFTDDATMNMFTNGQKTRMRALFGNNNLRNSFLASFACDSTLATGGQLPPAVTSPVVTPTVPSKIVTVLTKSPTKSFAAKVYPSPAVSSVTIEYVNGSATAVKTINVYNVLGGKVLTAQLTTAKTALNISSLTKGIYIVSIEDGNNKVTTKIVKN